MKLTPEEREAKQAADAEKRRLKDEDTVKRDSWQTPQALWDTLNKQYHFTMDCCASKENAKCTWFCMDFENVTVDLGGELLWMNPPFSKAAEMFTRLARERRWVAIYRGDSLETHVWQKIILPAAHWIFVFDHRTKYEGQAGDGARFNSILIGKGVPFPEGLQGSLLMPMGNR